MIMHLDIALTATLVKVGPIFVDVALLMLASALFLLGIVLPDLIDRGGLRLRQNGKSNGGEECGYNQLGLHDGLFPNNAWDTFLASS